MATAANKPYASRPRSLPRHKSLVNSETFSPERVGEVELSDGSVHALPLGTTALYMQHRLCGDHYCLIEGKKSATATGDTPDAAFLAALKAVQ